MKEIKICFIGSSVLFIIDYMCSLPHNCGLTRYMIGSKENECVICRVHYTNFPYLQFSLQEILFWVNVCTACKDVIQRVD